MSSFFPPVIIFLVFIFLRLLASQRSQGTFGCFQSAPRGGRRFRTPPCPSYLGFAAANSGFTPDVLGSGL